MATYLALSALLRSNTTEPRNERLALVFTIGSQDSSNLCIRNTDTTNYERYKKNGDKTIHWKDSKIRIWIDDTAVMGGPEAWKAGMRTYSQPLFSSVVPSSE